MFNSDQQESLTRHLEERPGDAAGLGAAVDWAASGWPDWADYQPIAEAALAGAAPLLAASWPRKTLMAVARDGVAGLRTEEAARLRLDRPRPDGVLMRMRREIVESHCGQLPETMIDPMMTVTIGLFEALPDRQAPPDYADAYGTARLPFDFVWFTPRADDRDPCEVYADALEKARERHLEQQEDQ